MQFANNATLDRDGGLVERSSCAAAGRGPRRARVLGQAAVAAGLSARSRSAINKQAKFGQNWIVGSMRWQFGFVVTHSSRST